MLHVPVVGSYSSALAPLAPAPTTSTFPLGSNVDVGRKRGMLRLPVKLHVPVDGSYNSAVLGGGWFGNELSTTRTLPLGSSVAVGYWRGVLRLPVGIQLGLTWARTSARNANVAKNRPINARVRLNACPPIFPVLLMRLIVFIYILSCGLMKLWVPVQSASAVPAEKGRLSY